MPMTRPARALGDLLADWYPERLETAAPRTLETDVNPEWNGGVLALSHVYPRELEILGSALWTSNLEPGRGYPSQDEIPGFSNPQVNLIRIEILKVPGDLHTPSWMVSELPQIVASKPLTHLYHVAYNEPG